VEAITTDAAPPSIGPFTQGIRDGDRIYISGQGPVHPDSGEIVGDTAEEQTARTLENIEAILRAAGRSLDSVVKATIYSATIRSISGRRRQTQHPFKGPFRPYGR
jgi:2-iminobutanoate/2-iminopropanoate deaminase